MSPLPPPGGIRFIAAWPSLGLPKTTTEISADPILTAAGGVRRLWDWEPEPEPRQGRAPEVWPRWRRRVWLLVLLVPPFELVLWLVAGWLTLRLLTRTRSGRLVRAAAVLVFGVLCVHFSNWGVFHPGSYYVTHRYAFDAVAAVSPSRERQLRGEAPLECARPIAEVGVATPASLRTSAPEDSWWPATAAPSTSAPWTGASTSRRGHR